MIVIKNICGWNWIFWSHSMIGVWVKILYRTIWIDFNSKQFIVKVTIIFFQLQFDFFRKRGNKHFEVFKSPPVNWCSFNEGQVQLISFQKIFINAFRKSGARLFHRCPFEGKHEFSNVTVSSSIIDVLPLGAYKSNLKGMDKDNNSIMTISATYNILWKKFSVSNYW